MESENDLVFWSLGTIEFNQPKAGQPRRIWSFGPLVHLNFNITDNGTQEGFGPLVQMNFNKQTAGIRE
jgi:hypothetical protein